MGDQKKRILIINDDETFISVYSDAFQKAGFSVETATNGKSGLTRILNSTPDLVLLGVMLPIMNGFDVLQVVKEREKTKRIPVIVCSHLVAPGTPEEAEAEELGAAAVFYKSACTPEMVIERASKVLQQA